MNYVKDAMWSVIRFTPVVRSQSIEPVCGEMTALPVQTKSHNASCMLGRMPLGDPLLTLALLSSAVARWTTSRPPDVNQEPWPVRQPSRALNRGTRRSRRPDAREAPSRPQAFAMSACRTKADTVCTRGETRISPRDLGSTYAQHPRRPMFRPMGTSPTAYFVGTCHRDGQAPNHGLGCFGGGIASGYAVRGRHPVSSMLIASASRAVGRSAVSDGRTGRACDPCPLPDLRPTDDPSSFATQRLRIGSDERDMGAPRLPEPRARRARATRQHAGTGLGPSVVSQDTVGSIPRGRAAISVPRGLHATRLAQHHRPSGGLHHTPSRHRPKGSDHR